MSAPADVLALLPGQPDPWHKDWADPVMDEDTLGFSSENTRDGSCVSVDPSGHVEFFAWDDSLIPCVPFGVIYTLYHMAATSIPELPPATNDPIEVDDGTE